MVNSTTSYAWSRIYSAGSRNSSRKQNVETTNMITSFLQAVTCMYISPAEYRKSLVESKDTLISEQHFHFAGTLEKWIDSSQVFGQESIFCKTMATWKCSPEFCVPILYRALLPRTSHERRDWSLRTHFRTPFFCHSESLWMSAQDLPHCPFGIQKEIFVLWVYRWLISPRTNLSSPMFKVTLVRWQPL